MIVVGLMSGTSMDGLDVAIAEFGFDGEQLSMTPLFATGVGWPKPLRDRLVAVLPPAATSVGEVCALDVEIGQAAADAVLAALAESGLRADLVVSHGQTVFHWISDGTARGTLQLGQPAPIVEATGLPVISDLRSRDIAGGGQGAPLASTLDALWLAPEPGSSGRRAALNLGGIANVSIVGGPGEPITAFDTGPANCLLDVAAQRLVGTPFDADGLIAASGSIRSDLLQRLLADPYYLMPAPKSTGRERFHTAYVDDMLAALPAVTGPDLLATLVELTAVTVADALRPFDLTEVIASGGGVRNPTLRAALARLLRPASLVTSDERGLPSDAKEAYLVALLGFLTWHGVPGVVPHATGSATPRVLGRISPGNDPLHLPPPQSPPRRLTIRTPVPTGAVHA
jgi:anhydro-N-acetylmuramic acid kinase